jgi:kynurenine formamidase
LPAAFKLFESVASVIVSVSVNPASKTISYSRVISLSHLIASTIPRWPGDPPVQFEPVAAIAQAGYYLRSFSLGEHSATHMNAPISFEPAGAGIEAYVPESLVVPAIVIDIQAQAAEDADYMLTVEDVLVWENHRGSVPAGSVVLLYTGWQQKWSEPDAFLNQGHFPGFGSATTQFLLKERQIAGVGIDTHGVDGGQDLSFATNRQVLAQQGIVLENLTNLDQLPPIGTTLVIGLLKLAAGSGSPASVLAFVP